MLHAALTGAAIVWISSDGMDGFVLLDINATVSKNGDKWQGILGMYARWSGCNTVSYPDGKGKVSVLKVLNQTYTTGLTLVLGEENATQRLDGSRHSLRS